MRIKEKRLLHLLTLFSFLMLFVLSCNTQYRVIRHGYPDVDDFKIFRNDTIKTGAEIYQIPTSALNASFIDSIRLNHPKDNREILLSEYLSLTKTKALIIIQDDSIVYEKYFDGYSKSTLHCTFSVTKSITSILAGVAISEFPELHLDTPITKYIEELRNKDSLYNHLTLNHLLGMKSGLSYSTFKNMSDVFCDDNMIYYTTNQKKYIASSSFKFTPGERRQYKSYDPLLVAWAIENTSGEKLSDYFSRKIWTKIGAEYPALWSVDEQTGLVKASSSFHCTASDLAKMGLLYLKNGKLNDAQIVPSAWIESTVGVNNFQNKKPVINTWWKPSQEYFWWFSTLEPLGDYYADGYKGQFIYINPNTKTVIVKFSEVGDDLHDVPFRKIAEELAAKTLHKN